MQKIDHRNLFRIWDVSEKQRLISSINGKVVKLELAYKVAYFGFDTQTLHIYIITKPTISMNNPHWTLGFLFGNRFMLLSI